MGHSLVNLSALAWVRVGRLGVVIATIRRRVVGDILPEKRGEKSLEGV
jgi:hypothetical protein